MVSWGILCLGVDEMGAGGEVTVHLCIVGGGAMKDVAFGGLPTQPAFSQTPVE